MKYVENWQQGGSLWQWVLFILIHVHQLSTKLTSNKHYVVFGQFRMERDVVFYPSVISSSALLKIVHLDAMELTNILLSFFFLFFLGKRSANLQEKKKQKTARGKHFHLLSSVSLSLSPLGNPNFLTSATIFHASRFSFGEAPIQQPWPLQMLLSQ